MNDALRTEVGGELPAAGKVRQAMVLKALGVSLSTWYYKPAVGGQDGRRRRRYSLPQELEMQVVKMAETNPWYGYKRIAVMCRRASLAVADRQVYRVMRDHGLLHRRKQCRSAELHQASKLYELLPTGPNDLWQMDVTYVHIPGHGWWYAVTVIDFYSRYLLGLVLTHSYSAQEVIAALDQARAEAERLHGPLQREPFLVTDNGTSFLARKFVRHVAEDFAHVRIQYRMPTQLGLLERFHETLKREEVYWRLYDNPGHARDCLAEFHLRYNYLRPHWALRPEEGGDPLVPAEVYVDGRKVQLPRWQGWARGVKDRLDRLLQEAA